MLKYSPSLARLIEALRILPGVGPKSAQRMTFHLLERNREGARLLAQALLQAANEVTQCERCRMLTDGQLCA
ncbi:MAG: recombination protein RecR, partial [Steroidobacteraceae bacterium]